MLSSPVTSGTAVARSTSAPAFAGPRRGKEQRRQHPCRQIDGDAVNPVKSPYGQVIEDIRGPAPNKRFKLRQVSRRNGRRHSLPLRGMARLIEGDEALTKAPSWVV